MVKSLKKRLHNCENPLHNCKNLLYNCEIQVHNCVLQLNFAAIENKTRKNMCKLILTPKEEEIMGILWEHGPMFVNEMVKTYPPPHPKFNTISTAVRSLEHQGFIRHTRFGGSHQYYAALSIEEYREWIMDVVVKKYFGDAHLRVVSALVGCKKITLDDLKGVIARIEGDEKNR